MNVLAAMVRLTSGAPFLDQLDHAARQAAAEAQSKQGLATFRMEEANRSIAGFEKVIAREPNHWPARQNLGSLLTEIHRTVEAMEQYRQLVEQFPESSRFKVELGSILLQTGDKAAALAEFKLAQKLDPRDRDVKQLIARVSP